MEIAKEQFGIEVTRLLKERKLTQRGLSERLGISSAAVCYLLKNQLRPSATQFDIMMEYLEATSDEINSLRQLWNATRKKKSKSSTKIENLFAVRCAQEKTLVEVAEATGLSIERLRILENKADATPTPDEAERLKAYYGPALDSPPDLISTGEVLPRVAEEFTDEVERSEKKLPVFTIDVLSRAAKTLTIEKFLGKLPFNSAVFTISPAHFNQAKAVLICDAEDIHFGFKGSVELILGEYDPDSTDTLHLGRGARGGFALWQKMRRSWKYFGSESPAPRMGNAWSLPVLEMRFVALSNMNDSARKK